MTYILRTHWGNELDTREIGGPSLVVGRGGGAQLRFDDNTIDLEHARIDQIDGAYALSDNGSTAGTYVNGVKVHKKILSDGDRITIGPYLLIANIDSLSPTFALDIHTAAPSPPLGTGADIRDFDYAAAYALYRPYWNKTVLTLVLVTASAALLLTPLKAGKHDLFQPALVRSGHAIFAGQCSRCHQPWRGVADDRCQECHGAATAVHQKEQASIPTCPTCHVEHHEGESLSTVADAQCRRCHADLRTKSGRPPLFEKRVTEFATGHPEFAFTVKTVPQQSRVRLSDKGARLADPARLKLNHAVHLKPDLKGPKGPTRLSCNECHAPAPDGTLFSPIRFESHCKDCHQLEFEPARPGRVVPHAQPAIVDAYLRGVFAAAPRQDAPQPATAKQNQDPATQLPAQVAPTGNLREVEARLFKGTCGLCHEVDLNNRPLPKIEPPDVPDRWFQHARFSHRSHRVLECNACHTRASKSRRTADVLIPGIQICQECHHQAGRSWLSQGAAAPTACSTCHVYHNQAGNRDWDGPQTVRRLLEENESKPTSTAGHMSSFERYVKKLATVFERQ